MISWERSRERSLERSHTLSPKEHAMAVMDLRGLTPAPVTAFTREGDVDHAANAKLAQWLVSFDGVKGLVLLGHAGEGTYLTPDEQVALIRTVVEAVDGKVPVIAGITTEGDKTAAEEAERAADAGATGALVYPSHGWLRFGFQPAPRRAGTRPSTRPPACSASSSSTRTSPRRPTTWRPSWRSPASPASSPPRTACATCAAGT